MQKETEFIGLMSGLAEIYEKELTPNLIAIWRHMLKELTIEDLKRAVYLYLEDPENRKFPLPAQLKAMLVPSEMAQARDAVSRIIEALATSSGNEVRAKEKIGSLGWVVVERNGGWDKLTHMSNDDLGPIAQAQWREMILAFLEKAKLGVQDMPPSLPDRSTKKLGLSKMEFSIE